MLDLTRLVTIGVAAMLAACIEDTTTERASATLEGSGSGSGSDSGCTVPTRLDLTVDRSTIPTALATSNAIVVTLTGSGGYGGTVTLSATLRDPYGIPLPGWSITLDTPTLYVPQNGAATAVATVTVPSEDHGRIGTARIAVASSAQTGISAAETTLIVVDAITIPIDIVNGQCVYPSPSTLMVKIGTKLRWLNKPTNTSNLVIHVDSNPYGVYHQNTYPGLAPGQVYEQTVTGVPSGTGIRWYCHSPGPSANNIIQPVQ